MKKILVVVPAQFGYLNAYYFIAKYLGKHFIVDLLCFDQNLKKVQEDHINIHYVNMENNKIIMYYNFVRKSIDLNRSIAHDYLICNYFIFSWLISLFCTAKIKILDIRTGSIKDNCLFRFFSNLSIWITTLFFNRVTVLSHSLATLLKLKMSKATILPLGAEVVDNSKKIYDRMHLLYVGVLDKRSIDVTIEGLSIFLSKRRSGIPIKYDIIGYGNEENESKILQTIRKNGLSQVVFFHGRKHLAELRPFFEQATIGVSFVPKTKYYDVQPPTKIFEYAMSGLITIATSTYESTLVINEKNGILCDDNYLSFSEALKTLEHNIVQYEELAIKKTVSKFKWDQIIENDLMPLLTTK